MITPQNTPDQNLISSLSKRLNSVGVQTFNFSFYPEGETMVSYNHSSPKAHVTRFTSEVCWAQGSCLGILGEFLQSVHPEDAATLSAYVNAHMELAISGAVTVTPSDFSSSRFRAREPGEPYRWYEIRSHLYLDTSFQTVIAEGCFLDITALCERERLLEQALADLEQAQEELVQKTKLAALGELASGVAHDFRNLLTPIQAYTEELKELTEEVRGAPEVINGLRTCLEHIETASDDSVSLIKRLQVEHFPQATPFECRAPSDLHQVVMSAWHQALPRWKTVTKRPQLQVHFEPGVELMIDSSVMRQACVNLFANALYAIERRAQEEPDAPPLIEVALIESQEHLTLELRDHGIGMSLETLERCRESFFSTKGGQGSGLGLHMVTRSIEQMGGTLELRSTLGEGTAVSLMLPRA